MLSALSNEGIGQDSPASHIAKDVYSVNPRTKLMRRHVYSVNPRTEEGMEGSSSSADVTMQVVRSSGTSLQFLETHCICWFSPTTNRYFVQCVYQGKLPNGSIPQTPYQPKAHTSSPIGHKRGSPKMFLDNAIAHLNQVMKAQLLVVLVSCTQIVLGPQRLNPT